MKTVYIALGSNLGDRSGNLRRAVELMNSAELHVLRKSSLYETAPQGLQEQPWFLNQVIEAGTTLMPRQLLKRLLAIELDMGRKRAVRNGPRLIDLDILLFGDSIVHTKELHIPHPRMANRRFVLEPLAELTPDLRLAGSQRSLKELLDTVKDQAVRRL